MATPRTSEGLDLLRRTGRLEVSGPAEAKTILDGWFAQAAAKPHIADGRERLLEQEPSEENERRLGIQATRARYWELDAKHDRTPGEEWELRELKQDAALASYPRLLELVAVPEKDERPRSDGEERELQELAERLPRTLSAEVVRSIKPRLAGPVITAMRAKAATPPRATLGVPRPREHRAPARARARSPDDDPSGSGSEPPPRGCRGCGGSLAGLDPRRWWCSGCSAERNRRHVAAHRARARANRDGDLLARYADAVARARRLGLLTGDEAAELLVFPSSKVLALLDEVPA